MKCSFDDYVIQQFSLPSSIIYYVTKNPKSANGFTKFLKTCKYFYAKNAVIILHRLFLRTDSKKYEQIEFKGNKVLHKTGEIDLEKIQYKIWITDCFNVYEDADVSVSTLILKLFKSEIRTLFLYNQNITYNEFLFLTSSTKELEFRNVVVKYSNGDVVKFVTIVEKIPKLRNLIFQFTNAATEISTNTVKEMAKIDHVKNIYFIRLINIPEFFDLKSFISDIIIAQTGGHCLLKLNQNVSDNYKENVKNFASFSEGKIIYRDSDCSMII